MKFFIYILIIAIGWAMIEDRKKKRVEDRKTARLVQSWAAKEDRKDYLRAHPFTAMIVRDLEEGFLDRLSLLQTSVSNKLEGIEVVEQLSVYKSGFSIPIVNQFGACDSKFYSLREMEYDDLTEEDVTCIGELLAGILLPALERTRVRLKIETSPGMYTMKMDFREYLKPLKRL